jgi:hypothetical protein
MQQLSAKPMINQFQTFKTQFQNLNERVQFEAIFQNLLIQRNSNINHLPSFGNTFMDSFLLFHLVVQEGGFETVF